MISFLSVLMTALFPAFFAGSSAFVIDSQPAESGSQPGTDYIYLADPTIYCDTDGVYYLYGTSPRVNGGFLCYRSSDLSHWEGPVGACGGYALVRDSVFGTRGFWAPQVYRSGDTYYMAYTANEQIAVATSHSPMGPFVQQRHRSLPSVTRQIDPFVFHDGGDVYLYHVRLHEGNRIYCVRMSAGMDSVELATAREQIHAQSGWENVNHADWPVAEGPTVVRISGTYYLFYSANDFRNPAYAVGYATSNSPWGPWQKHDRPLISQSDIGIPGTGHGDLFQTADGRWFYVFHTHRSDQKVDPRRTALVELIFADGQFSLKPGSFAFLRVSRPAR